MKNLFKAFLIISSFVCVFFFIMLTGGKENNDAVLPIDADTPW